MNRLIEFLVRYKHWFLFFILEIISLLLVFNNSIHHSAIKTSAINIISGYSNDIANRWYAYVELKEDNEKLLLEKASIENKYLALKKEFDAYKANNIVKLDSIKAQTHCKVLLTAQVININKVSGNPYLIINKGTSDGVALNMGVVSSEGVVGSIMSVSQHYALVIPITNPKFQLNCFSSQTGSSGTLISYGIEKHSYLKNIPKHIKIMEGDSILTGKDSYIFPEGLLIGTIAQQKSNDRQGHYLVRLASKFNSLHNVYVINKKKDLEIKKLEEKIRTDD